MLDINVDESATSIEKITISSRSLTNLYNNNNNLNKYNTTYNDYSTIKCYKNLPSITTLEAKSINIIKIHKTIFFNLSNLINIDLHHNKLLKISKNFKLFKNLKSLKLDSNQISFIPSFIGDFPNLEIFTISNNLITYIPTSIKNLINLKILNFSNNKVQRLPIELGQLESLISLYFDGNYFTSIPTTLCYLKRLNELSFDWLEFVDPPYYRLIKDSVGKTIICIIIKCLDAMLKQSLLYCDFKNFVEKISPKKSWDENDKEKDDEKTLKMSKSDLIDEKNIVTPVATFKNNVNNNNSNELLNNKYNKIFQAIEYNYYGVIKSLLESEDVEKYLNAKNAENKKPFYLAINSKNDEIIDLFFDKIKEKNIKLNYLYLFKAIRTRNPQLVKKLIEYGISPFSVDDQGKGVFHILFNSFTKQISKCILIGDYLLEQDVPLNFPDMDNWAPIHIATSRACKQCLLWIISSNEIKEIFDLNLKGRNGWTPLHLTISSFRIEETLILLEQGCDIFSRNIDAKTPKKVCAGNFVFSKLLSHCENLRLRDKYENKEKYDYDYINNYLKNGKSEKNFYFSETYDNDYNKINNKNKFNILKRGVTYNKMLDIDFDTDIIKDYSTNNKLNNNKNEKEKFTSKKSDNIKLNKNNFKIPKEQKVISDITSSIINEESVNINTQKEKMLNCESHLNEKYEAFMFIKMNKSCNSEIIRNMLDNLELTHLDNINLISDICSYILSNFMTSLIPCLKSLISNKLLEKCSFIKNELKNTINILEKVSNKVIIPVNKQKTKVSSKSIMNHKYEDDDDDDGKFIQDSEIMSNDLIEEDNDLNFNMMKDIWIKNPSNFNNDN